MLKFRPPTKDAFIQHIKRSAFATVIEKQLHVVKPTFSAVTEYGWVVINEDVSDLNFIIVTKSYECVFVLSVQWFFKTM